MALSNLPKHSIWYFHFTVTVIMTLIYTIYSSSLDYVIFSITLSHQGPAKRPKPIEKGVTIFTIHKLNLNTEKNPSPVVI